MPAGGTPALRKGARPSVLHQAPGARVPSGRAASRTDASRLDLARGSCSPGTVPRDDALTALVPRLVAATYFEDAATAVLEAMFACAETALAAGPYAARGRLLRGVVHLRRRRQLPAPLRHRALHGRAGRGRWVRHLRQRVDWIEEHRCSVSIDVQRASLRSWLPEGPIDRLDLPEAAGLPGDATRERMLGRDATHVHVVPLRAPGGSVDGMITLEASCKAASGHEFVWEACHEELGILASVAGAFIAARALPRRPADPARADEFLPVVGRATTQLVELLGAFAPAGRHNPFQRPDRRRQVAAGALVPRALAAEGPAVRGASTCSACRRTCRWPSSSGGSGARSRAPSRTTRARSPARRRARSSSTRSTSSR